MGYRSDVAVACTKEAYLRHALLLKEMPSDMQNMKTMSDDNLMYWFFTGWKWYPSYPEVKAVEKFVAAVMQEDDTTIGIVRIGEELDDITYDGDPFTLGLDVYRTIDTPFGMVGVGDDRVEEN